MLRKLRSSLALALVAGSVVACGGSDSGTTGQLTVRLTDAPGDYVQSATVWISSIYLIGGNDTTGTRYTVTSTPQSYDLMTLQNGVTTALGTSTIPVGDYSQMRMVVDSARVTLKAGITIGGASTVSLQTPSAQRTGIKVNFSGPLHVAAGQTILVVDFDVARNFVFQGPRGSPTGVSFKPVLHAVVTDIAASIAGTVGPAAAAATKPMVYAIASGDTVSSAVADSATGAYRLRYLDPRVSPFNVVVVATGYQTQNRSVPVRSAQDTTGVNFTLVP
ncbi:MAG: DUF4382 domain-containing protein [Gemmatimonadota bacterium]